MINDALRDNIDTTREEALNSDEPDESPNPEVLAFFEMLKKVEEPLYERSSMSALQLASRLLNIKCEHNLSQRCFDSICTLIGDALQEQNVTNVPQLSAPADIEEELCATNDVSDDDDDQTDDEEMRNNEDEMEKEDSDEEEEFDEEESEDEEEDGDGDVEELFPDEDDDKNVSGDSTDSDCMSGPRHFQGSGSGAGSRSRDDEHRELAEEELGEIMVNADRCLPTLSPTRLWFHDNPVKTAVRKSIQAKMDLFAPTWYAASDAQRDTWFNHFKCKFQFKKKYEDQIRDAFTHIAVERIPDYVYRAGKGEGGWMSANVKEQFLAWRNSDDFKTESATKKKNRTSEEGKAAGTHIMGHQNMIQFINKESQGKTTAPTVPELVKKTKTSKKGNFISNIVKKIFDKFTPTKKSLQSTQPDTRVDDNRV